MEEAVEGMVEVVTAGVANMVEEEEEEGGAVVVVAGAEEGATGVGEVTVEAGVAVIMEEMEEADNTRS